MNQDERFDAIAKGQSARLVHAEVGDRVSYREAAIINRLVSAYRAGKLNHDMTVSGIAAIAELRSLVSDLETEIKQGLEAVQTEHAAQAERYS